MKDKVDTAYHDKIVNDAMKIIAERNKEIAELKAYIKVKHEKNKEGYDAWKALRDENEQRKRQIEITCEYNKFGGNPFDEIEKLREQIEDMKAKYDNYMTISAHNEMIFAYQHEIADLKKELEDTKHTLKCAAQHIDELRLNCCFTDKTNRKLKQQLATILNGKDK